MSGDPVNALRRKFLPFIVTTLLSLPLTILNLVWSAYSDLYIAKQMGAQRDPNTRWMTSGGMTWTFSAPTGPIVSLAGQIFLLLIPIYAGITMSALLTNVFLKDSRPFGRYRWLLVNAFAFWLLKIPVPIEYSLFYHLAVLY